MGFIYDSITKLTEEILDEDKMVKFEGEISPKFGWCTILMGGAGSGKGTTIKKRVAIPAKIIDVDELKNPDKIKKLGLSDKVKSTLETNNSDTSMDLSNDEYVSVAHSALEPYANSLKKQGRELGKSADSKRLPNVIFDITGKEYSKIETIINAVKPYGYKIALVFVLADIEEAKNRNFRRRRTVRRDAFLRTHLGVLKTLDYMFDNNINKEVDEFWLVDSCMPENIRNVVYNIKDGYTQYEEILNKIIANEKWLENPISQAEWDKQRDEIKSKNL